MSGTIYNHKKEPVLETGSFKFYQNEFIEIFVL